jgi:hypothetical protein
MYIEHRSDRVTTQCAAFHGALANPASLLYLPFWFPFYASVENSIEEGGGVVEQ